jgi:hypothetical protein
MVIREPFDLLSQNGQSPLVLNEVRHEISAGVPDAFRVLVNRREYFEHALKIHVL